LHNILARFKKMSLKKCAFNPSFINTLAHNINFEDVSNNALLYALLFTRLADNI